MTLTSIENIENLSIRDNKVIEKKDITNGQKQKTKTEEKQDEQIEPLLKVSMAIFILLLA